MELLFEDKERVDNQLAYHLENDYNFYDRTAIPEFVKIRVMLNEWFARYPDAEKKDLKSNFKAQFSSAFFELFVHELFVSQGFTLTPHPVIPGTEKRPDFLAKRGDIELYLEAKEATDESNADRAYKNKVGALFDSMNKMNCPNYFLIIDELSMKSSNQPRGKIINSCIEKEIKKVDKELLENHIDIQEFFEKKKIIYDDEDVYIVIKLIPLEKEYIEEKNSLHRPIGVYPSNFFWGGSEKSIKDAVKEKAGRYGIIDKPFIICINSTSRKGTADYSVFEAILGSSQFSWSTDPNNKDERFERRNDGVFRGPENPTYTRISGVLITNVHPSSSSVANHWLIKHPYTNNDLDFSVFDLSYMEKQGNSFTKVNKSSIGDILNRTRS